MNLTPRLIAAIGLLVVLPLATTADAQLIGDGIFASSFEDEGLPPDPASIAPPPAKGVPYDIYEATQFLYTGASPIQTGVVPGTIASKTVAVIRGRLLTGTGSPLRGATVSISAHPEFGQTLTRSNGEFDLVVNGGELLFVNFSKDGFLPAQRKMDVPWRDFVRVDDAVLAPLSPIVTTITAGSNAMQVASGAVVTDADGTRQATMMFPSGVSANMVMPDGGESPLSTLNVRATEYTVGPMGPMAMPGELPGYSAYTYAVELSVDEAMTAGATSVEFDAPVPIYVDNFLEFPAGAIMPAGYYDRIAQVWRGSDNGIVMEILGAEGALATIDSTGSGTPDDAARLAELGISEDERQLLATRYAAGDSLWRVPVTHFTPWDLNQLRAGEGGPVPPDRPIRTSRKKRKKDMDPCAESGSIVECQNQVLGERVPVTGSSYSLNYRSDRSPGYSDAQLTIPLTESETPDIDEIVVEVFVAGQNTEQRFAPAPNLTYEYEWDGRDAYGRSITGTVDARIRVTYVTFSTFCYVREGMGPRRPRWGSICDSADNVSDARRVPFGNTRRYKVALQGWSDDFQGSNIGLGGWTLDPHHFYDGSAKTLYLGDGSRIIGPNVSGASLVVKVGNGAETANGANAFITAVGTPSGLAVAADGRVFYADKFAERVRVINLDNRVSTVAGQLNSQGYDGDGGPASAALLNRPDRLAIGIDGSLYISDSANRVIRRIDPDGIIDTVAGGGLIRADSEQGLGALATELEFASVQDIKVASDGVLYLWDLGYGEVYSVNTMGLVESIPIPGGPLGVDPNDRIFSATDGCFHTPVTRDEYDSYCYPSQTLLPIMSSFDFQSDGSLLIADAAPGGGDTDGASKGGAAFSTCLKQFSSLDGNAIPSGSSVVDGIRVNRFTADPIAITLVGRDTDQPEVCRNFSPSFFSSASRPAVSATLSGRVTQIIASPDGGVYIGDDGLDRILKVEQPFANLGAGEVLLSAPDDPMIYRFDGQGRHIASFDPLTGSESLTFAYSDGLLTEIRDAVGNRTQVERSIDGTPAAIVAPFGQRTTLGVETNGYLSRITNPASESYTVQYDDQGLLTQFTYPNGDFSQYSYSPEGLLTGVSDSGGYALTLDSEELVTGETEVVLATAGGATTRYEVNRDEEDNLIIVNTDAAGARYVVDRSTGENTVITRPTGLTQTLSRRDGSRFGVYRGGSEEQVLRTPNGRTLTVDSRRTVSRIDPENPASAITLSQEQTIDGKTETLSYDPTTRLFERTTAVGRISTSELDTLGRTIRTNGGAGLADRITTFDGFGRTATRAYGNDQVTLTYDSRGRVEQLTDNAGRSRLYTYDNADRIATETSPGGRTYTFEYDGRGRRVGVTMPNGQSHLLSYNTRSDLTTYQPPSSLALTHTYDVDSRRTGTDLMNTRLQQVTYDAGFRASTLSYPEATSRFTYVGNTQLLQSTEWDASGSGIDYSTELEYDGELLTATVLNGERIAYGLDSAIRVSSTKLASLAPIAYAYDDDNLLTTIGPFSVSRDGPAGRADTLGDGTLEIEYAYDSQGRLAAKRFEVDDTLVYELSLTHETGTGHIVAKSETVTAETTSLSYGYNLESELTTVAEGASTIESYTYDVNGNRTTANGVVATYDNLDQIETNGSTAFSFDDSGMLQSRGGDDFVYGARGELLAADLTDGTSVTYSYDVLGRQTLRHAATGTTHYLFGDPSDPFRVSASKAPDDTYTQYFYDDGGVLIALDRSGTLYYVATDQVGSPRLVMNTAGGIEKRIDYDSFGRVTNDTNPAFNLIIGFAGGIADPDTGLVRFGLRDYDPSIGRWTARDPLLFDSRQYNLYAYVGSNPISYRDPSGLICVGGSIYAGAGGGAKVCYKDGKWSLCGEVGLGAGGGVNVNPLGAAAKRADADSISVEASAGCGPFQLGLGLKLDDCGKFSTEASCKAGPFDPCKGEVTLKSFGDSPDQLLIRTARGKLGCKVGAAIKGTLCIGSNI